MTLTLDLAPDVLARLEAEAAREGVPAADFAVKILTDHLFNRVGEPDTSTAKLFKQWAAEDATDDPQELAARARDWEELKAAMNESHSSPRKLFP